MRYVYQEFPRTLHKADGLTLTVHDEQAKESALAEGWSLHPVLNGHVIDFEETVEVEVEKPKRGRPRKDVN